MSHAGPLTDEEIAAWRDVARGPGGVHLAKKVLANFLDAATERTRLAAENATLKAAAAGVVACYPDTIAHFRAHPDRSSQTTAMRLVALADALLEAAP